MPSASASPAPSPNSDDSKLYSPPSIASSRMTSWRLAPSARLMPSSVRRSRATSENTSTISNIPLNSENAPSTTNRSVNALPHRSA